MIAAGLLFCSGSLAWAQGADTGPDDGLLGGDPDLELRDPVDPVDPVRDGTPGESLESAPGAAEPASTNSLFPYKGGTSVDDRVIVGIVVDERSRSPLQGAAVLVTGVTQGALTNDIGRFVFDFDLTPGVYDVSVSRDGYFTQTKQVEVKASTSTTTTFLMKERPIGEDVFELDPYDVVEELTEKQEGNLVLSSIGAGASVSFLGAEQISKSGSSDVAGAAKRIAGVNVVGGRYAVIRGLGDRYSNTTLNRLIIPSADPSKKAVQLDLFPTDLIEDLVVYKTFRPDLSAEFAGGSIDIRTKRFPEERILSFGVGLGFNNATKEGVLYLNKDRRIDWIGRSGDDLPDGLGTISGDAS
ncbi:MAG: carboxypeptidase regulatory-like domain-containing protein, partial [Verrucomicrobia bacterium]|nr:carboxypeptidase regulatory-like domain-containing protein [Verrucomicrobiota bacterium]